MTFIPWGTFEPDRAQLNNGLLIALQNGAPSGDHYRPMKELVNYSVGATDGEFLGGISVRLTNGTVKTYVGDPAKLYELATDLTFTDRSKAGSPAYTMANPERWWGIKFGTQAIMGGGSVTIQEIDIDSGTVFADLGGSPPTANYAGVIGPHIILGATSDGPGHIRACKAATSDDWTTGGGANGILQEFKNYGWVRGISSGRLNGYIYQDEAVQRAGLTQDNAIFDFELLTEGNGLAAPWSLCRANASDYYLSQDGFIQFNGQEFRRIGHDRVDRTFYTNMDQSDVLNVTGVVDPEDPMVWWFYRSSSTTDHDSVIVYDYLNDRWGAGKYDAGNPLPASTLAMSLEDIDTNYPEYDLDTLPWSLDDRVFEGGLPALAAFTPDKKLGFFNGANKEAIFTMGEIQLRPGRRAIVKVVSPIDDADGGSVSIGTREKAAGSFIFGSEKSIEVTGMTHHKANARYHQFRRTIAAGLTWEKAHGIDIQHVPGGNR